MNKDWKPDFVIVDPNHDCPELKYIGVYYGYPPDDGLDYDFERQAAEDRARQRQSGGITAPRAQMKTKLNW